MQATHPASEASSGAIRFGSKVTSVMPTLPPGLRITTLPTGQMLLVYSRNTSSRSTFCWRAGAVLSAALTAGPLSEGSHGQHSLHRSCGSQQRGPGAFDHLAFCDAG